MTDSSALISLAKCGLIETLCGAYDVVTPSSVIAEVASKELVEKYPDAALIAHLVRSGKITVQHSQKVELQVPLSLGRGERDALLLGGEMQNALIATDDRKAIRAAKFMNVGFIITPRIVVDLFRLGKISFEQARKSMEKLAIFGRYSPDIIANALLMLGEENK